MPPRDRRQRPPTITDVARAAGVSAGTVSNTLTGKRPVDPNTRARIEDAIATLGYTPNLAARGLRARRANLIALCSSMPPQISGGPSQFAFMMEVAAAVSPIALQHGVAVTLLPSEPGAERFLSQIALDGAIVIEPLRDDPFLRAGARLGLPIVTLGLPPSHGTPHADLGYTAGTRLLCTHLREVGAQCFPLVTGAEERIVYLETITAYRAFAAEVGMEAEVIRLPEAGGEQAATAAMRLRLARGGIDAVLASVDTFASATVTAAYAIGLSIPGQLRIATRHDGLRARQERPPLTAVDLNLAEAAADCVRMLLRPDDTHDAAMHTSSWAPQLIVRGSTLSGMP